MGLCMFCIALRAVLRVICAVGGGPRPLMREMRESHLEGVSEHAARSRRFPRSATLGLLGVGSFMYNAAMMREMRDSLHVEAGCNAAMLRTCENGAGEDPPMRRSCEKASMVEGFSCTLQP